MSSPSGMCIFFGLVDLLEVSPQGLLLSLHSIVQMTCQLPIPHLLPLNKVSIDIEYYNSSRQDFNEGATVICNGQMIVQSDKNEPVLKIKATTATP
jgi:hypothetical protein